jgi:hypothetical protein
MQVPYLISTPRNKNIGKTRHLRTKNIFADKFLFTLFFGNGGYRNFQTKDT